MHHQIKIIDVHLFYVSLIYNKHELKTVQLLGNFNKIKNRKINPLLVNSHEKEIRLTFVLLIFSNLMTIAQAYKILERQERVSIRLNFVLFSVCYMERVRCLVFSTKTLFSTNQKNVTFHKSTYLHNFDISLPLTNSKTQEHSKKRRADRRFNKERQS